MENIYEFSSIQKECQFIASKILESKLKSVVFYNKKIYKLYISFLLQNSSDLYFFSQNKELHKELSWIKIFQNGITPLDVAKISDQDRFTILSYKKNSKNELISEEFDKVESFLKNYYFDGVKSSDEIKSFFSNFPFFNNLNDFKSSRLLSFSNFLTEYSEHIIAKCKFYSETVIFVDYKLFNNYPFEENTVYFCPGLIDSSEFRTLAFPRLFDSNVSYFLSYFYLENRVNLNLVKQLKSLNPSIIKEENLTMSSVTKNDYDNIDISLFNVKNVLEGGLAVTKIKRYVDCPNYFWLSIFDKTRFQLSNSATSLGSACHLLVASYLQEIINGNNSLYDNSLEKIKEIISSYTTSKDFVSFSLDDFHTKLAILKSSKTISETLDFYNNSNFAPASVESKLGENLNFEIELSEDQKVKINGIVDRIDKVKDSNSFSVVDFKSGQSSFSQNDFQLSLYAAGLQSSFPDSQIVGLFSQKLSESMIDLDASSTTKTLLSGPFVNEEINNFDINATNNKESKLVKYKLNKDGSVSKTSSGVSSEEINNIIDSNIEKAKAALKDIIDKKSFNSFNFEKCKNCPYNFICR